MTTAILVGQMNLKKNEFKWEIANSHCLLNQDNAVVSPEFTINDFTWQVMLYPKGFNKAANDYVSIFLHLQSEAECTTSYSLSIINNDQSQCNHRICGIRKYTGSSGSWGILKFVQRRELLQQETQYLSNDKLVILIELYPSSYNISNVLPIDIEEILGNKQFCDVELLVKNNTEEVRLYTHKNILSKKSKVFAAMFEHNMKENIENTVCIEDVDQQVLVEMLRFMYTGEVKNIESIAEKLLMAAEKYAIFDLKDVCCDYFYHNLSNKNAIQYLNIAILYNTDELKHLAKKYILINIKSMVGTSEFRSITDVQSDELYKIICSLVSGKL